jgi:hypothetical protein
MKIIISERQYSFISEQPDSKMPFQIEKFGYNPSKPNTMGPALKKQQEVFNDMDNHTVMTILQIGSAFIPFVGPFISAGIGLYDAKMYYDEGDTKTAGLVGLFACIPGIGGLASKLGLAKWTAKALGELGKKISIGSKLLPQEIQVANIIAKNKNLILSEIKASPVIAKELAKKVATTVGKTAATVGGYAAVGGAYSKAYDTAQKDTPRAKAESEGMDWNLVKTAFGSSGTEQENKLLNQAWSKGWRPGQVVPQGFQTETYKTYYEEDINNIKQLQALIAQAS